MCKANHPSGPSKRPASRQKHKTIGIWSDQSEFDLDTIMRPEPLQGPLKFFELCNAVKPADELAAGRHDHMKELLGIYRTKFKNASNRECRSVP